MRLDKYVALADAARADTTPYKADQMNTLRNILSIPGLRPDEIALRITTHAMENYRLYRGLLSAGQTYEALYDMIFLQEAETREEKQFKELLQASGVRKGPVPEGTIPKDTTWEDLRTACSALVARALAKAVEESGEAVPCAEHMGVFMELSRAVDNLNECAGASEDGDRMKQVITLYYVEGRRGLDSKFTSKALGIGDTTFFRCKKQALSRLSSLLFPDQKTFISEVEKVKKELDIS